MSATEFLKRVDNYQFSRGITRAEAMNEIGVSEGTLSRIRTEKLKPSTKSWSLLEAAETRAGINATPLPTIVQAQTRYAEGTGAQGLALLTAIKCCAGVGLATMDDIQGALFAITRVQLDTAQLDEVLTLLTNRGLIELSPILTRDHKDGRYRATDVNLYRLTVAGRAVHCGLQAQLAAFFYEE